MNITTHSSQITLTNDLIDYALKKISKLEKFLLRHDAEVLCAIELGKNQKHRSGDVFSAEVTINHPGMKRLYAHAAGPDIYTAIDRVRDEMEREINSQKKKHKSLDKKIAGKIKRNLKRI